MKTVLRFMKPYKGLCFFTLLVTILDVAGGLLIPRLTADMVNMGVAGGDLGYMLEKRRSDDPDRFSCRCRGLWQAVTSAQIFQQRLAGT